jgi:hypothetical protein
MEWTSLSLLSIALIGGAGMLWWQRHRGRQLPLTSQSVRCPLHDCQADVTVRTNPRAPLHQQHVGVTACSLLPSPAVALPERTGYLPDFPLYKVRLEAARPYPSPPREVSCRQHCLFLLNEATAPVMPRAICCTSGVSDGPELARQVIQHPAMTRLLWYYSL